MRPSLHPSTLLRLPPTRIQVHRSFTTITPLSSQFPTDPSNSTISSRWLSETKNRIGRCITFGLEEQHISEAGSILKELATDWRELSAGSEGFLTKEGRRGLWRHEVVWGDEDSMYAESARINWARNYASYIDPSHKREWSDLWTPSGIGLILRSIKVDFKFPMTFPDHVTVLHKLRTEPQKETDHFILDVLIMSELHQRPAARCIEDIVVYDYKLGRKAPLKPFMVAAFRQTWREQEDEKVKNRQRIGVILKRVRQLEKGCWDRDGAVEKMGV